MDWWQKGGDQDMQAVTAREGLLGYEGGVRYWDLEDRESRGLVAESSADSLLLFYGNPNL